MRSRSPWFWRGSFVAGSSVALLFGGGACGDDDDFQPVDAGTFDTIPPTPPPYDAGTAQPDGSVDTTGRFGAPVLVADFGQSIDGPSWRAEDQSLYFTVPGAAPSLRRLMTDGGVVPVDLYDGGPPGPYGTATGGGAEVFVTEPSALVVLHPAVDDSNDASTPATLTRVAGPFELLGDIAVERRPDASTRAVFVDTAGGFAYRYDPALGAGAFKQLMAADAGGVRATGIALGPDRTSGGNAERTATFVAVSTGSTGAVVIVEDDQQASQYRSIQLEGVPPNGIALDQEDVLYVAWAKGIEVYQSAFSGQRIGNSPGFRLTGGSGAPTNLAFGGPDLKTLYITTSTGQIWAVPMLTPGILR